MCRENLGVEEIRISALDLLKFKIYLTGDDTRRGYTSLKFRNKNWVRNINMRILGIQIAFNTMRLCWSSKEVRKERKKKAGLGIAPWSFPTFPNLEGKRKNSKRDGGGKELSKSLCCPGSHLQKLYQGGISRQLSQCRY